MQADLLSLGVKKGWFCEFLSDAWKVGFIQ
jgi:hypothetical protein